MLSEYIIAQGSQLALNILKCLRLIFMAGCVPLCLLYWGDKFPKSEVKCQ